jgi:hypothetical protein
MDIFGVLRVTWLPRARPHEPNAPVPEQPGHETLAAEPPPDAPAEPSDNAPADNAPADNAPADNAPAAAGPDVVRELIGLADDLLALTAKASDSGPSPRTLGVLQRRVDRLLEDCGVRILRDDGPVVPSRHEIVRTRLAGPDDTEGWIASTVRRGYLHGDRLIRPQLVVAYAAGPPAGTKEGTDHEG